MATMTISRFEADPAAADDVCRRHAELVAAVRAATPGLVDARLGRVDDTHWIGVWHWESAERVAAARTAAPDLAETAAAFGLARDVTVDDVEILDGH
jgi:hypothetical protein